MARDDYLFNTVDSFSVQEHQRNQIRGEIEAVERNRLLNTNVDDLVNFFVEKFRIDVPVLDEAGINADQREAQRDVSGDPRRAAYYFDRGGPVMVTGTEVTIEVPFSGDPQMFKIQPSTYSSMPPRGAVRGNVIEWRSWGTDMKPENVRAEFDKWRADVSQYLEWQRSTFAGFNDSIAAAARSQIEQRRQKLLADQNLVAGLGFSMKRRSDAPTTYTAPEVRRKIAPKMPPATTGAFKPEPVLEMAEYENVISIMRSMVHVMERSPKAFQNIDEEALRTHFLMALNAQYQGGASGETFNYEGKTDILIRSGDRNVFIAECKFWGGPQKLIETVDQLLGYLSWRDSKAAVLIFNRNKDFSKVVAAIPGTVKGHPKYRKEAGKVGDTGFRYVFRHKDDEAKEITVTVLAFDVPRPE